MYREHFVLLLIFLWSFNMLYHFIFQSIHKLFFFNFQLKIYLLLKYFTAWNTSKYLRIISYDIFLLFKVEISSEKDINSLNIHSYIISMWSYPLYILMHVFSVSIKLFNNISCVPKEGKKVIFLIFPQVCFKRNQDFTFRWMYRINRILFVYNFYDLQFIIYL